jgi:serralysin
VKGNKKTEMKQVTTIALVLLITLAGRSQSFKLKGNQFPGSPCTTPVGEIMYAPVDTTERRGVADNYKIWENGKTFRVKFMYGYGSQEMRQKVMNYAKEWEQYANITFTFVSDNDPETDIRIRLGSMLDSLGHNSYVGQDCRNEKYKFVQTMNLDTSDFFDYSYYINDIKTKGSFYLYLANTLGRNMTNYTYAQFYPDLIFYPASKVYIEKRIRRKSQHEFGHALGLLHEQSYPGGIKWNRDTIYKYYARMGWSKKQVDFNVLEVADQFYTNGTSYDPKSIMHYPVQSWQTLNGFSVEESTTISDGDKKLISALYPRDKKISDLDVPKVMISNFSRLDVKDDASRRGFVVLPSFDLRTGSLLASAYFVARLVTEDGQYYIPTSKQVYSWNGMAATYLKANLPPNTSVSYNKGANKMELVFPYSEVPAELQGKKFKVEFTIYQIDAATDKMDRLVMYSQSGLLSMSTLSK